MAPQKLDPADLAIPEFLRRKSGAALALPQGDPQAGPAKALPQGSPKPPAGPAKALKTGPKTKAPQAATATQGQPQTGGLLGRARPAPASPQVVASEALLATLSPACQIYCKALHARGRLRWEWLLDASTVKFLEADAIEYAQRKENSEQRTRERLAAIPKKVSPLHGLIPLREILRQMGDAAPKRKHAVAAIDASKMVHTRYHWPDSPVTLAHVRKVLAEYKPPQPKRHAIEFEPSATIKFTGNNPKKAGTSAHERWERLRKHSGKTVEQFLAAGGMPATLNNAIKSKHVTLTEKTK